MTNLVINKKKIFFVVLFCLYIFGAVIQVNGQSNDIPSWINYFPPEDEIWGIGVAKLINSRNSMNLAELRARAAIVSQIYSRIIARYDDDEFNNLYTFFLQYFQIEASFEIINATWVLRTWEAPDGTSWCLVAMRKSDSIRYLSIFKDIYQNYYKEVFNE